MYETPGKRQIHQPYQIRGRRIYDRVRLERQSEESTQCADKLDIQIPRLASVGEEYTAWLPDGTKIIFTLLEAPENLPENAGFFENICKNRYTKWLDYDTIFKPLRVRTRQTGDYLTIRGKTDLCHKKLKDYMVTEKIPQDTRDKIFVIAEENHVLWLAGYRISEHYKVTINTKKILQVQWVR